MDSTTLVLVFLDSDNNEKSIVVKDPKANLTKEAIVSAMETIITNDAFVTASGKHLETVSDCYYKTISIVQPTAGAGE